jgi:hypothetical protein
MNVHYKDLGNGAYGYLSLQIYDDEFELNKTRQVFTHAEQGKVLMKCDKGRELGGKEQTKYRSGVGKLQHMMR